MAGFAGFQQPTGFVGVMSAVMRWLLACLALLTACSSAGGSTGQARAQTSLATRLKAGAVNCHGQQLVGDVICTFHGKKVTVTPNWTATAKDRKRACQAGYINKGYVVATNGHVAVTADQNTTTQAVAKAMRLRVERYCP